MKVIEIIPRRKHISGIRFDVTLEPSDFGADVDPVGLLALDSELCEIRLKAGMELTDDELLGVVRESHIKRAKSRAMWYLSRSSMPKEKLRRKLLENFPDYAATIATERAEELGFVDDAEYAKRKLQLLIDQKKVSVKMAAKMLLAEGVERSAIDEAMSVAEYDPYVAIKTLVESKYKHKLSDKKDFQNTVAALMRKGFSYSEVKSVLNDFLENSECFED